MNLGSITGNTTDMADSFEIVDDGEIISDPAEMAALDRMIKAERKRAYRKSHAEYVEKDKQRWAASRATRKPSKPFAGVDGEGATVDGDHRYVLLRAGEHALTEVTGEGLRWDVILDWLCHLPNDLEYVAFAFDYDVTMILRSYTMYSRGWRAIKRLTERTADRAVLFHDGDVGWWVWYRPRMEFKVSPARRCPDNSVGWCSPTKPKDVEGKPADTCHYCGKSVDPSRGHMFRVSDTIKLFQSTFLKVVGDWQAGTPEIREVIQEGKDRREIVEFLDDNERQEVTEYNRLECQLLAEIMTEFRNAWLATGMPQPPNWQSPGSLAVAAFRKFKVPTRKAIDALGNVPQSVWDFATHAMYGGWFEVSQFGPTPGYFGPAYSVAQKRYIAGFSAEITEYDLTSAYPHAATQLPCLLHSTWEHRPPRLGEYALQAIEATYDRPVYDRFMPNYPDVTKDQAFPVFMGLPYRDQDGRVSRPLETTGVYWNFEIEQAKHQNIKVVDSWTWVSNCDCDGFGFIRELFELRKSLGSKKGKPVKLAINSMYGKLAQRIGDHPPYVNLIAASFITAWTRSTIMRTIHETSCEQGLRCGSNVIMVATDAVFFAGDPGLPAAKKAEAQLGDWTREVFPDGLFIVQGGVYWPPGATEARSKTRGIPVSILHEHIGDFETAYQHMMETHNINNGVTTLRYRRTPDGKRVEAKRFVGMREATHRNARHELGKFVPFTRDMGFDWTSKRVPWPARMNPNRPLWTLPKSVDNPLSTPYAPVQTAWHGVPAYMGEQGVLDALNDSPEWLPVIQSPADDDSFGFESDDAMHWSSDE